MLSWPPKSFLPGLAIDCNRRAIPGKQRDRETRDGCARPQAAVLRCMTNRNSAGSKRGAIAVFAGTCMCRCRTWAVDRNARSGALRGLSVRDTSIGSVDRPCQQLESRGNHRGT
jgi:hypothetical protein